MVHAPHPLLHFSCCMHTCFTLCRLVQVLVDARDWEYDPHQPPMAYVAEELLTCPELEAGQDGKEGTGGSWLEVRPSAWLHGWAVGAVTHMGGRLGHTTPVRKVQAPTFRSFTS